MVYSIRQDRPPGHDTLDWNLGCSSLVVSTPASQCLANVSKADTSLMMMYLAEFSASCTLRAVQHRDFLVFEAGLDSLPHSDLPRPRVLRALQEIGRQLGHVVAGCTVSDIFHPQSGKHTLTCHCSGFQWPWFWASFPSLSAWRADFAPHCTIVHFAIPRWVTFIPRQSDLARDLGFVSNSLSGSATSAQCAWIFGCWLVFMPAGVRHLPFLPSTQCALFFGCWLERITPSAHRFSAHCASFVHHYSVPNTCIGGSGAWTEVVGFSSEGIAPPSPFGLGPLPHSSLGYPCLLEVRTVAISQPAPAADSSVIQGFLTVCKVAEAFFKSLLILVLVAILQLLYRCMPGKASPVGKLLGLPLHLPLSPLCALAVATPARPVLVWNPPPPKQMPRSKCCSAPHPLRRNLWCRTFLYMFGILTFPTCVWAVPGDARPFLQAAGQGHLTPDTRQPLDLSPEAMLPQSERFHEGDTECLPRGHDLLDKFNKNWLGVTVYAPFYPTTAFGLQVRPGASFPYVCKLIRDSGRLPCLQHDAIVAVHLQIYTGSLSVISYPTVIGQGKRQHCAVLIDISRVGGSCYAATLPADAKLEDLWTEIGQHMNVDIESEEVRVWVGDSAFPASPTGTLSIINGSLITVYKAEASPTIAPTAYYAANLLMHGETWDRVEHLPSPQAAHCMAVGCGQHLDPVVLAFFPRFYKHEVALQVTKYQAAQADVVVFENDPPLDLRGEPCTQTALVLPKEDGPVWYFLDTRPMGIRPRLVHAAKPFPDLPEILQAADIEFPEGLCGETLSSAFHDQVQLLRIGYTQDLASRIFAQDWEKLGDDTPPEPPTDSCSAIGGALEGNSTASPHAGSPAAPRRFGQAIVPPEAHETLELAQDDEEDEAPGEIIHFASAIFLIFAPRYAPEICRC